MDTKTHGNHTDSRTPMSYDHNNSLSSQNGDAQCGRRSNKSHTSLRQEMPILLQEIARQRDKTQHGSGRINTIVKRANGILKTEWPSHKHLGSFKDAQRRKVQVMEIYNTRHPHLCLVRKTQVQVYTEVG